MWVDFTSMFREVGLLQLPKVEYFMELDTRLYATADKQLLYVVNGFMFHYDCMCLHVKLTGNYTSAVVCIVSRPRSCLCAVEVVFSTSFATLALG